MKIEEVDETIKFRLDGMFRAFSIVAGDAYVFLCHMGTDVSRWSKKAVEFFDLPSEYIDNAGALWEQYIHPDDRETYRKSIEMIFSGADAGHDMQYRARSRTGEYVVCTCRGVVLFDQEGRPDYFAGAITNHGIQTQVDSVTGLRNQYGFFVDLETDLIKRRKCVLLQLGINKFSDINSIYGYDFGNRVLQHTGRSLMKLIGSQGSAYRLDGAKYLIKSYTMDSYDMDDFYADFKDMVRDNQIVDGKMVLLDFSAGMLVLDRFDANIKTLFTCLDYAYSESKHRRQGNLVTFFNRLDEENSASIEKLNEIRNSIGGEFAGFFLCYQPVVDAATERLKGAEALLRWRSPKFGEVPPNDFIPVLEQDNRFPDLGMWVLEQAITDAKSILEQMPDFVINVNVSYVQFERMNFVEEITSVLQSHNFPPASLCLEITERSRLLDLNLLQNIIVRLRQIGVKFALDDFGTGFSSLNVLKKLAVDIVKIDRNFVANIEDDPRDQQTVKYVCKLASVYGAEVCAEGIENVTVRDYLRKYEVGSLQGFLYSRPVPFPKFKEYQRRNILHHQVRSGS